MKKNLKRAALLAAIMALTPLGANALLATSAEAFSATEEVIGSYDHGNTFLAFTVTNDYFDIIEFAIGNPDATYAWTEQESFFTGAIAHRDYDNNWTTYVDGYYDSKNNRDVAGYDRDLNWMENPESGFADYDTAFLFTSWQTIENGVEGSGEYSEYLPTGLTKGYYGETGFGLASPVAAFSITQGTIDGGEAQVVPVPGAIWLLGSGLLGLVGFRRRKNDLAA